MGIRKPEFTKIHFSIKKVIFSNLTKLTVYKNTAFVPCGFKGLGFTIPGLTSRMPVNIDF